MTEPSRFGTEPLVVEETWRGGTYALLGRLLAAAPEQGVLDQLVGIQAEGLEDKGIRGAWAELSRQAKQGEPQSLFDEYHALFVGLGRGELVPYASWYRTGFLMERPLLEVRATLHRLGIVRQEAVSEPEDHIAVLCESMAMLISDASFPPECEREFFADHLSPWSGRFFADLEHAKSARFYSAVGRLGSQFMDLEAQCQSMSV